MKEANHKHKNGKGVDPKISWEQELEIKDLVHPIVLKRRRIVFWGLLAVVLLAASGFGWYMWIKPPSGEKLLSEMVTAAGGQDAWNNIHDGVLERVHQRYDELGNPTKAVHETYSFKKTDKGLRLLVRAVRENGDIVIIGRDDNGFWSTVNGDDTNANTMAREMNMMCESDMCDPLCAAEMAFYRFSLPFKLTDPGVVAKFGGYADLNGKQMPKLDVTFEKGVGKDRWVFLVHPETKLIQKIEHYASATGNYPPEEIYWSDFKKNKGVTFSHTRSYFRTNGTKLEEYRITEANFNGNLSDEYFSKPVLVVSK